MKKKLQGKVVWITGSSSGIGLETAYACARLGATLILTALEENLLEEACKKCKELGAGNAYALPFDLSKLDQVAELADKAWSLENKIDIFYNNAGISQRGTTIETEMSVINKVMNINYFAPVIMTKQILPRMVERGSGQLVVTTSINGRFGFPLRCAYSSSKHALYGFFETVQAEYYKQGIRVTIVCPGRVQTKISFYALEKDGKQHAKMDAGQAAGCTAQQAGRKIARAICKKKREVLVGRTELLMVYIKRFFPSLCAKIARSINPT
ncbi:MAG: SDR family oxidoreductase [Bacteroidaceae bacterium]|nr:SDR family oxidoreductase [Bacteroidaceae bacterium]